MQDVAPTRFALSPESRERWLALAALVGANVALAFGPWFVRLADVGPVAVGFWRVLIAVPVLMFLAWRINPGALTRGLAIWPVFVLSGIAFAADLATWHSGIVRTTLANATLLGNSTVLLYPIWGFIAARALPGRWQRIAFVLAAAGAGMMLGRSAELSPRNVAGDLFSLSAGVLYTIYFILMARARTLLPPLPALAWASAATVLPLLAIAWVAGETIWPGDWSPLLGVALVSQVLGQGLMIYALGRFPPLVVGIALLVQPMVSATIGWAAYGEQPGLLDAVGAVMVAVALVLVRRGDRA